MNSTIENSKHEFIHSWYLFLMTILTLFFLLINHKPIYNLFLTVLILIFFSCNGLRVRSLISLVFVAFLFSSSFFAFSIFYPAKGLMDHVSFQLGRIIVYKASLSKAKLLMLRLFLVSLVSMSSGITLNYTKIILHLIIDKGLKLFWGYPLLLAINSIAQFKSELERIKINSKIRNIPLRERFAYFFPLLVFAIRHSQRGALSLVTRGLNEQKSFYFRYELNLKDKLYLIFFITTYLTFVGLAIFSIG